MVGAAYVETFSAHVRF